jgi:hypothetical protein
MVFTIEDQSNQEMTYGPGLLTSKDLLMKNLSNCQIFIFNFNLSAQIINCHSSRIIISALSGMIEVHQSEDCIISSASSEVSIENSKNLTLFLFTETEPVIKNSSSLKFAPFNVKFSGQDSCFTEAHLNCYKDKWSEVHDLNRNESIPHYELLNPKDFKEESFAFEGAGDVINPVPRHAHYGGSLKYEIIPYSKSHSYTIEKKDLPPSSKIIHSENDTRKDVPYTRPLTFLEPEIVKVTTESEVRAALKYFYLGKKGFDLLKTNTPPEAKEAIESCLNEFKILLNEYHDAFYEIVLGTCFSIVSMFVCLLLMQILRMTSEWFEACVACVLIFMITSEILVILLSFSQWKKLRRHFTMVFSEFNERKKVKLKDFVVDVVGTFDSVEIYITNVKS